MLTNALSMVGREALRIVLPSWCIVCDTQLPWRQRTAVCCSRCWAGLPRIEGTKCRSCARPLPEPLSEPLLENDEAICIGCSMDPMPVDWCDAWGRYDTGLERVLHAFKFERCDFMNDHLAALLEETLRIRGDLDFDAIVPVPMHPSKRRRRGYNQAELLSAALSRRLRIAHRPELLKKLRDPEPQSRLPRAGRAANVRNLFQSTPKAAGRSILIVDDISTTGETLRACARELLREDAARICAIAVAKA